MRLSAHVVKLINSLQVNYRLRVESERELEMALEGVEDLLGDFEPDVLEATRKEIARTYNGRDFPAPALLFRTAQRMKERKTLAAYASQNPLQSHAQGRAERFDDRLVCDLLRTSIGRQAASDGWAGALRDFVKRNGHLPEGRDVKECQEAAQEFDETLAELYRGPQNKLNASLIKLGESILHRRRIVEDFIAGKRQDIAWTPIGDTQIARRVLQ